MTEERKGESFILGGAIIWSFFPIFTILSYKSVPSMISLTVSTFLASVFALAVMIYRGKLYELKNKLLWKYAFVIVVSVSILYYGFYYFGLTRTTAGNAALIDLFHQKAKLISSAESILFLRTIIATPFILLFAYLFGQHLQVFQIKESLLFLVLNGFFILGLSKIFWIEGVARIPVTKANALNSLAPLFTLFVAWLVLHQAPTIWQISSLVPFFFGVLLLTDNLKLKNKPA